jgi:protein-S-isoprenylcysteine O-methyltransferase Ste14
VHYRLAFLIITIIVLCTRFSLASDISLTITQKNLKESVLIEVLNTSAHDVVLESVEIELNQKRYINSARSSIRVGAAKDFVFSVQNPHIPGTYALLTTARYLNEGSMLSITHADYYHHGEPALLPASCIMETTSDSKGMRIYLTGPKDYPWRLFVPEEFEVLEGSKLGNTSEYHVRSKTRGFTTVNRIFGIAEKKTENSHRAAICSSILTFSHGTASSGKGRIPGYVFIILACFFQVAVYFLLFISRNTGHGYTTMSRYGSRMFFLCISCWILKESNHWLASSAGYLTWPFYKRVVQILLDNINGGNYLYFFQFFVDAYFVLCLLLAFPCLYFFSRQTQVLQDKYVASLTTVITIPRLFTGKYPFWNGLSRLGFLTIMVKFFFTPMMVSWAIGSALNMLNGFRSPQWNIFAVNACLVQFLILVDTIIFSLGYLFESKYLKNEIKSVEPTLLGWLVCLWCYPPFNTFSFRPLDLYIIRIVLPLPTWLNVGVLCAITCLWGIFVWASIALGFKASNLTNRGVVRSGPYRYVRHPAYMAKLMIWILQGVFFAQFGIFILLGFVIIYALRAWTEERHLSRDSDYLAYKQSVRWWFIPGVV